MPIPPEFLDEIRSRVGLADVIGRRVKLSRRGRELTGLCPFHNEKTPSFTVNEAKGFYHCFGCGAHGSVIDFMMQANGLAFREAVERLAEEAGLSLPQERAGDVAERERKKSLRDAMEAATRWFERQLRLASGEGALAYLKRRGVSDDSLDRFRLGFALEDRGALRQAMHADGFDDDVLAAAGLIIRPEDRERAPYGRFRGRVIFPICDVRGRVIAFGGRLLGPGEPKYLNSPETPLFHKGTHLYALHLAAEPARSNGTVVVAEGYMDVIGLHQAGITHAVAPLGTALTEAQLSALWGVVAEPTLLFDPDAAGERAALRAAERALPLLTTGRSLRFARLRVDTGDDPDGVARRFPITFLTRALADALPLSEFLFGVATAGQRLDLVERRARIEADLTRQLRLIADRDLRNHLINDVRQRLRAAGSSRRAMTNQTRGQRHRNTGTRLDRPIITAAESRAAAGTAGTDPSRLREAVLLAVVLNHPDTINQVGERLGGVSFADPILESVRQATLGALADRPDLDSHTLTSQLRQCGFSACLDVLLGPGTLGHAFFARLDQPTDVALAGWEETFSAYRQQSLQADIEAQKRRVGDNLADSRRYGALEALIREKRASRSVSFGPDDRDDLAN